MNNYPEHKKTLIDLVEVVGNAIVFQPYEYIRFLMTVGYIPPAYLKKSGGFGQGQFLYSQMAMYASHIYHVNGITGFLPGLEPRLITAVIRYSVSKTTNEVIPLSKNINEDEITDKSLFLKRLAKETFTSVVENILTQPFCVVTLRSMAQFIGRETKYNGVYDSLKIIYKEQGVSGLFSGIIPRLIRNVTNVIIVTTLCYAVKVCLTKDKELIKITNCVFNILYGGFTYPLQVVSTCMAVNDPGLKVGSPPEMPIFDGGWLDCWSYLKRTNRIRIIYVPLFHKGPTEPTVITDPLIPFLTKTDQEIIKTIKEKKQVQIHDSTTKPEG